MKHNTDIVYLPATAGPLIIHDMTIAYAWYRVKSRAIANDSLKRVYAVVILHTEDM